MVKSIGHVLARRRTPLGRAAALLESFAPSRGFEPYTFSVWAWPPKAWRERPPQDSIQRSLRFELGGCCSHLTLFAARDSRWRRETERRLVRAGYERWLSHEGSVDLRRWLRGRRDRLRELAFLRDLGDRATPVRWPRRRPAVRPVAVKLGRWARPLWWRVVRDVEEARIHWDDAALGLSRLGVFTEVGPRELHLVVSAVAFDEGRLLVFASASLAGTGKTREPMPPRLARAFRQVVSAAGFRPDGFRSSDRSWLRGRVGFERQVNSAAAAVSVCARTFEAMSIVAAPRRSATSASA